MPNSNTQPAFHDPTHLIIVCCHAIWLGGSTSGEAEIEWALESFQHGETPVFVEHIKAGLEVLYESANGVLLFSGSATKADRTDLSEAESYLNLARVNDYYSIIPARRISLPPPILLDTYAVDSYQNLLFPLLAFCHLTNGEPPAQITIVSHSFKRQRFLDLHCRALRWPLEKVRFVGINPDTGVEYRAGVSQDMVYKREAIERGEEKARKLWTEDLYGVGGELGKKREQRGWMGPEAVLRDWGSEDEEQWMRGLVEWSGGESGVEVYRGWLPWDKRDGKAAKQSDEPPIPLSS
ncbi:hypothetical protein MMC13_003812 [Lambiella insularis]|nr:hypothetical protein [Lambiella insularis]